MMDLHLEYNESVDRDDAKLDLAVLEEAEGRSPELHAASPVRHGTIDGYQRPDSIGVLLDPVRWRLGDEGGVRQRVYILPNVRKEKARRERVPSMDPVFGFSFAIENNAAQGEVHLSSTSAV